MGSANVVARPANMGESSPFKYSAPSALSMSSESFDFEEEVTIADTVTDVAITALRIGTCALMIHHGIDKVQNVDGFSANVVAKFFGFLPGPPAFWTLSAAATQIAGSGLLAVGVLTRPVAFAMSMTMA